MGISRDEADGEEVIWMAEARKERKSEEGQVYMTGRTQGRTEHVGFEACARICVRSLQLKVGAGEARRHGGQRSQQAIEGQAKRHRRRRKRGEGSEVEL